MRIVAQDLTYTYNAKSPFASQALCGVTLTIEEGEFFGIIGHTGSGKSTFVQHLNALIRLTGGSLKLGEYDLADKKCKFLELRSKVGMVFQYPEYQLFAETVEKDVMFGLKNFAKDMKEEEMKAAVREALEIVDLNYAEIKDKSPFELSGGQKRRVAIAGVIVTKPEVLRGSTRSVKKKLCSFCTPFTANGARRSSSCRTTWTRSAKTAPAPQCLPTGKW